MSWRHAEEAHRWREIERRTVADTPIFTVSASTRRDADQNQGEFVLIEAPEWVTVIPLFEENGRGAEFLMVRQYRHGSEEITVEFPAGAVDPGEAPQAAAARELIEETGYKAAELIPLGAVNPNPAFMTNKTHTYLARGLTKVAEQSLDLHEFVEFARIPEETVLREMGSGEFGNGVMLMSLSFYRRWRDTGA